MSKVNYDSINRLNLWIKNNLLTGYDRFNPYRMECTKVYPIVEDTENRLLISTFHVKVSEVEYALSGEIGKAKDGTTYEKKDYNNFKVKSVLEHDVELTYPMDNLGLIESNGKRKTTINSAKFSEVMKFFKYTIKLSASNRENSSFANIFIKLFEKDKNEKEENKKPIFLLNLNEPMVKFSESLPLANVLDYYGILYDSKWCREYGIKEGYSQWITEEFLDSSFDESIMKQFKNYKINPRALDKLEILSKGAFKPESDYLDSNTLDFILSQYFVDYINSNDYNYDTRNCEKYNMKTPLDFNFMDASDGVLYELADTTKGKDGTSTRGRILSSLYSNYAKKVLVPGTNKKVPCKKLHMTQIQNVIDKYFRLQTDNFHDVQSTKDSNTLSILSQNRTIYFYQKWDEDENEPTSDWRKQRLYNKSFNGVLDPTRTRDSGLVNKNNEFALGTEINDDNELLITVINVKTGKEEKLTYTQFCKEPILVRECYDETNKKVKVSPTTGKYEILQYLDYSSYEELPDNVKYARSKLNELSYATAMIPGTNGMVSTRTLLASHFLDQSIPVIGAQPTVVHTKMPKHLYENNPENVTYDLDEDGEVVGIKDQLIKIQTNSGKIKIFGKDNKFVKTSMDTTNEYKPVVKVGDKVTKNTILETSNSFVDGEFTTQVPLYVMFGTYKGMEHEDGIILTKSAAKKFTHVSDMPINESPENIRQFISFKRNDGTDTKELISKKTFKYGKTESGKKKIVSVNNEPRKMSDLEKLDIIDRKENLDEWSLIKKGSIVRANSLLFEYIKYNNDEIYAGLGESFGKAYYNNLTRTIKQIRVPYNVRNEGTVTDVHLYINGNKELFNEGSINDLSMEEVPGFKELQEVSKEFVPPKSFGIDLDDNKEAYDYFKSLGEKLAKDELKFRETRKERGKSLWSIADDENLFELEVVIQYADELTNERLGAKLSNYYASKGVNVYLIPDEYAPKDKFGNVIEGIISTGTTFSRQNPRQIDDCKLGLIGLELGKIVSKTNNPTTKLEKILNNIYPHGWNWKKLKKDSTRYGYCRIEEDYFDEYYTHSKILEILNSMGLGNGDSKIYLPEFKVWTEYETTVGITSMMRLHFIQEHKASVTPDSDPIYSDNDNITYREMDKEEGQKMGNMEMMAEVAQGELSVLRKTVLQKNKESKHAKFNSALIGLGLRF